MSRTEGIRCAQMKKSHRAVWRPMLLLSHHVAAPKK